MRVGIDTSAWRRTKWHEYLIRFGLGGTVTVLAALIAKRFGAGVGGLFLAFPSIFPSAATLIASHEKRKKAEEGMSGSVCARKLAAADAAGAAMGWLRVGWIRGGGTVGNSTTFHGGDAGCRNCGLGTLVVSSMGIPGSVLATDSTQVLPVTHRESRTPRCFPSGKSAAELGCSPSGAHILEELIFLRRCNGNPAARRANA